MAGTVHPLCDLGKSRLEPVEVDEGAEEGRDLDIGLLNQNANEGLETREGSIGQEAGGARSPSWRGGVARIRGCGHVEGALDGRSWRRDGRSRSGAALNDLDGLVGEVSCEGKQGVR